VVLSCIGILGASLVLAVGVRPAAASGCLGGNGVVTAPVISPAEVVGWGQTLTTTTGVFCISGTYSYQWYRDGSAISGATSGTYTTTSADFDHTVTVVVTDCTGFGCSGNLSDCRRDALSQAAA
jgi:hypothetical protein